MMDRAAVAQTREQLPQKFRQIDILVNNAGLALGTAAAQNVDMEVCFHHTAAIAPQLRDVPG